MTNKNLYVKFAEDLDYACYMIKEKIYVRYVILKIYVLMIEENIYVKFVVLRIYVLIVEEKICVKIV
jgi:hypothetical protein